MTLDEMRDALAAEWSHADQDDKDPVIAASRTHEFEVVVPTFGICALRDELTATTIDATLAVSGLECN